MRSTCRGGSSAQHRPTPPTTSRRRNGGGRSAWSGVRRSGSCSLRCRSSVGVSPSSRTTSSSTGGRCRCSSVNCSRCMPPAATSPCCLPRRAGTATTSGGSRPATRRSVGGCGRSTWPGSTARRCWRRRSALVNSATTCRTPPRSRHPRARRTVWWRPHGPVASRSTPSPRWLGRQSCRCSPTAVTSSSVSRSRAGRGNWPASSPWSVSSSTPCHCEFGWTRCAVSASSVWPCSAMPPSCVSTATCRTPNCVRSAGSANCSTASWSMRTSRRAPWSAAVNSTFAVPLSGPARCRAWRISRSRSQRT
ncbi:Uncharacterised protein [Mycobacteroides abscessus subsp. abscessus]|nr:Uncharacterised protein [Mycobacteroides abscessus subsp. abscessus]